VSHLEESWITNQQILPFKQSTVRVKLELSWFQVWWELI